jgi:NAD(P)-dependent dehydrogenase (short-subunit alcohol dehydrogenase family)
MTGFEDASDSIALTDYLVQDLFAGQTVFLTGGSGGLNLAIARCFARLGAKIGMCGRSLPRLESARAEIETLGAQVSAYQADVRDMSAVEAALDDSATRLGPANVIVCGAAGNFVAEARTLSSNGFRAVVEIDLVGSFHAARAGFEQLRATRGNLIFVSAGQSMSPFAQQSHVGAAKAGIDNLMRNLALEWGPYGVRANSIVPGPVAGTEGMRRLADGTGVDVWNESIALRRFAQPEEIAAMAVVLASPLARYVTGAQVVVDGGLGLSGFGLVNQAMYRPDSTRRSEGSS